MKIQVYTNNINQNNICLDIKLSASAQRQQNAAATCANADGHRRVDQVQTRQISALGDRARIVHSHQPSSDRARSELHVVARETRQRAVFQAEFQRSSAHVLVLVNSK